MSEVTQNPDAKAAALGLVVRRPKPNELFVDIDSNAQRHRFLEGLHELATIEPDLVGIDDIIPYQETPSQTRGHSHIIVRLQPDRVLHAFERVAYQILLGSDPKRELLAIKQINLGLAHDAVCFFEESY